VRRRDEVSALVKLACERYGKLDVLVNNAGIAPIAPLDDLRVQEWEDMIDINIKGVLYGIAAALPVFRKQGFRHFVNTASTAGLITYPTMSVYSGTKFAVRAISEGLRRKPAISCASPSFHRASFKRTLRTPSLIRRRRHKLPAQWKRSRSPRMQSLVPLRSRSSSRLMLTWAKSSCAPPRSLESERLKCEFAAKRVSSHRTSQERRLLLCTRDHGLT